MTGNREGFCATPLYARQVKSNEIEMFANALEKGGKATLLVQTLTGNNFEPCGRFATSCTVAQKSIFNLIPKQEFLNLG